MAQQTRHSLTGDISARVKIPYSARLASVDTRFSWFNQTPSNLRLTFVSYFHISFPSDWKAAAIL